MFQLSDLGLTFKLSVLGQVFTDVPGITSSALSMFKYSAVHYTNVTYINI